MGREGGNIVPDFPNRLVASVICLTMADSLVLAWDTYDARNRDSLNEKRLLPLQSLRGTVPASASRTNVPVVCTTSSGTGVLAQGAGRLP